MDGLVILPLLPFDVRLSISISFSFSPSFCLFVCLLFDLRSYLFSCYICLSGLLLALCCELSMNKVVMRAERRREKQEACEFF